MTLWHLKFSIFQTLAPLIATGANPAVDMQNEDASGKVQSNQYGDFQDDVLPSTSKCAQGLRAPLIATSANPDTQNEDASGKVQSNQHGDLLEDVSAAAVPIS